MEVNVQDRNPYASPRAKVQDADRDGDYGEIKILSAAGRLGRVRYIAYSMVMSLLFGSVIGIAAAAAGQEAAIFVTFAGYIVIFAVAIMLTIQRAHDFDSSGWLSLLMFVPLVGLIFWFIPGTQGENRFGKPPPPNTTGVIVLACLVPILFFVGIIAAIAIPAYQGYVQRAQYEQSQ
jgi:uncharacterized membrane protein YhaH (DUF805 family)